MTEIILLFIFLIPAMLGLAELLHILKLFILKPQKPIISYKVIFLTNDSAVQQLQYILEQYMWIGKNNNFNLVVVNSLLSEENYDECKLIANKHNLTFCSVEELDGYLKILAG